MSAKNWSSWEALLSLRPIPQPACAVIGAFAGSGKAQEATPEKSYIAIATSIPKVGEHYHCKRIEKKSSSELNVRNTETTTVLSVKKLASNVYVAMTRNSYYVTKVFGMSEDNVQFAVIESEPVVGSCMKCRKLAFAGEKISVIPWNTTAVQEVKFIKGLYKVKTINTTYVCLPVM